jgi:hypothetical protein
MRWSARGGLARNSSAAAEELDRAAYADELGWFPVQVFKLWMWAAELGVAAGGWSA